MSMTPRKWYLPDYTLCREFDRTEYPVHAAKRGRIAVAYRQDDARAIACLPDLVEALRKFVDLSEFLTPDLDMMTGNDAIACQKELGNIQQLGRAALEKAGISP